VAGSGIGRSPVRRWHTPRQGVRFVGRDDMTRYDGPRSAPNVLAVYLAEHDRHTGEAVPLLHVEWRAKGAKAVRSLGIATVRDLAAFDHRSFWRKRLLLMKVADEARLGRAWRTRFGNAPAVPDARIGHVLAASFPSVQEVIDVYCRGLRLNRVLRQLPNDRFLPPVEALCLPM
jgi:hypothetical protein